jgi:peptidoglycan hydrolase-like protein with peptidoglycan-binding domain
VLTADELSIRLVGGNGKPRPSVPWKLTVGGRTFSGTSDDQGRIDQKLGLARGQGTLEVDGRTLALAIGQLAPLDKLEGVQARLRNLGYSTGEATGQMNDATKRALELFQERVRIKITGAADDPTRAALKSVYGS